MIKSKSDIITIGCYQTIGGVIGVLSILYILFETVQLSAHNILLYALMFIFFSYSIFCGILCLQLKEAALQHSVVNQLLQLVNFAFYGIAFSYVAGLYLSVGFDVTASTDLKLDFGISKFDISLNRERKRTEINFNLVACALIFWIGKLIATTRGEKKLSRR